MHARRSVPLITIAVALLAILAAGAAGPARPATAGADTGWVIESFQSDIVINDDGSIVVIEAIEVDFGSLERHGIYRDIPIRYDYGDGEHDRLYRLDTISVTDAQGKPWEYDEIRDDNQVRLKIGDPDRTVSGRQTYRIMYAVAGALNAFDDHDELFWNVNGGNWDVPIARTMAVVSISGGGFDDAACFEGFESSDTPCVIIEPFNPSSLVYGASRPLSPGEQLTIVTSILNGAVDVPAPILVDKPQGWFERYVELNPLTLGGAIVVGVLALLAIAVRWWQAGRDRIYTSVYYLTQDPAQKTRPLGYDPQVVVEYTPPDDLRPAQMGVLLDEEADTKDVTATIVDLAVRGYLTIEEKEKSWVFGKMDWRLTKKREPEDLQPYELTIFTGLFGSSDIVDVSDLKNLYYISLREAQKQLYEDVTDRRWFAQNPAHAREAAQFAGLIVAAAGAGIGFLLGRWFGGAIIGLPIVVAGALVFLTAGLMSARTAAGSEALRRTVGFRQYIETAETSRQEFNERANIFAEYLPFAIVFGSVEKWASVFRDIDTEAATRSWYTGTTAFQAAAFSSSLSSFSSSMSSVIASTPGGSGGSGFGGGGGAGGGGGGRGGGSW